MQKKGAKKSIEKALDLLEALKGKRQFRRY
jgi:hypothetical protein